MKFGSGEFKDELVIIYPITYILIIIVIYVSITKLLFAVSLNKTVEIPNYYLRIVGKSSYT